MKRTSHDERDAGLSQVMWTQPASLAKRLSVSRKAPGKWKAGSRSAK